MTRRRVLIVSTLTFGHTHTYVCTPPSSLVHAHVTIANAHTKAARESSLYDHGHGNGSPGFSGFETSAYSGASVMSGLSEKLQNIYFR